MRKFKKNSAVSIVIIPPHGRVHDTDVLEGEEYAKYAPAYLTEILPEAGTLVLEAGIAESQPVVDAEAVTEAPSESVDSESTEESATLDTATPVLKKNKGGRPRKQAVDSASKTEAVEE